MTRPGANETRSVGAGWDSFGVSDATASVPQVPSSERGRSGGNPDSQERVGLRMPRALCHRYMIKWQNVR